MSARRAFVALMTLAVSAPFAWAVDDAGYAVQASSPDAGGAGATSGGTAGGYGAIDAAINEVHDSSAADAAGGEFDAGGAGATSGGLVTGGGAAMADQVRGTIDSVDPTRRRVTVRDDQGNLVSYDLTAGAAVQVGQRDSSLSALSSGDNVAVTVSDDDPTQARGVRVLSPQ